MRADTTLTRQNLIDAFCILFKKKGEGKITIKELVKTAGYNRGTFYKYFRDIYDVLEQIEKHVLNQIKDNFRNKITPENFETTFLEVFTKIHREQANYFDVLLASSNKARFEEKLIAEISSTFMETFGLARENPKSKYLAEIYFVTVITGIRIWINDGRKFTAEELSKFIGEILSGGVMNSIKNFPQKISIVETLSKA